MPVMMYSCGGCYFFVGTNFAPASLAVNLPITLAGVALNGILALFNAYAVLGSFALGS